MSVIGEGKLALSKLWLDTVDSSETQALIGQHAHTRKLPTLSTTSVGPKTKVRLNL